MIGNCNICFDEKKMHVLHDKHICCIDCFKQLINDKCPFCRTKFKMYEIPDRVNKYQNKECIINLGRYERRLSRNRRKNFLDYDEYLLHKRKIKARYKHLSRYI